MSIALADREVRLPRADVRFPVELRVPAGMRPADPGTWPRVDGRLEYVNGRLYYMPPCGDEQQDVASDVTFALRGWSELHGGFVVGSNEAGMILGEEVRAADVAVWRMESGSRTGGYRRLPPILAVEIAGQDEGESELRTKASWYLSNGVGVVWLVFPARREVLVVRAGGETRYGAGETLPAHHDLPGLAPAVDALFAQLERGRK